MRCVQWVAKVFRRPALKGADSNPEGDADAGERKLAEMRNSTKRAEGVERGRKNNFKSDFWSKAQTSRFSEIFYEISSGAPPFFIR